MLLIIPYVMMTFRPASLMEGARAFLLIGLVFLSVLFHELGHLVVARAQGVQVAGVVLWVLGGAAMTEREPDDPGAQLLIAGAGPLVNLIITALLLILLAAGLALTALLPGFTPQFPEIFPFFNFIFLIVTNLILAVSNLLPIYPLDGGRIFKALLQMFFGPVRSALVTFWLSTILGLLVLLWAVIVQSWLIGGTALLLVAGAVSLNQGLVLNLMRIYARLVKRPELFIRLSDFDPAVELLTRQIERTPGNPDLYLQRAYAAYYLEDYMRALADTERVLGLQPNHLPVLLLRSAMYYAMGQNAGAWDNLERVEQIHPGWAPVYLNRSILLRDAGRLVEALDQVNLAIAKERIDSSVRTGVQPLLVRSSLLYAMGDHESARRDWEEAQRLNPREATVFSPDRVRIFARSWPWAMAYFAWLQTRSVERSLLAVSCAETALRAGEYRMAVEQFTEAIRLHPGLRDLCYYRGLAYLGLGDQQKAGDDFRSAEQITRRAHIRRLAKFHLRQMVAQPGIG